MKAKLPSYIGKCFLVSGCDDVESIVEINTTDSPIQNYIEKRKACFPKCIGPHQSPDTSFEFPPGHRIRIEKFIKSEKHQHAVKKVLVN